MEIKIKPLSVNEAWQGKRFKSPAYKDYEKELLYRLPALKLPPKPYYIIYEFGFSNMRSDIDNPVKPFQDVLQKKYNFDDADILKITVKKVKVKKGEECIRFEILTLNK